jgi:hypothetical protein
MIHSHTHHPYIVLDEKLKSLAFQKRWKEYNTFCGLQCNQSLKQKANQQKIKYMIDEGLLENVVGICAICLCKYKHDICNKKI